MPVLEGQRRVKSDKKSILSTLDWDQLQNSYPPLPLLNNSGTVKRASQKKKSVTRYQEKHDNVSSRSDHKQ